MSNAAPEKEAQLETAALDFTLKKKVFFALVPLLVLLVLCEVGLRVGYYHRVGKHDFAISHALEWAQWKVRAAQAEGFVEGLGGSLDHAHDALYAQGVGKALLAELKSRYSTRFEEFAEEVRATKAKLLVVFIPGPNDRGGVVTQRFFRDLATRAQAPFLDLTGKLGGFAPEQIYLLPENGHPSRFGSAVIAEGVKKSLVGFGEYRSPVSYSERPQRLGDLRPNMNEVSSEHPKLPYRLVTNSQGLRMEKDVEFPKTKQRILFLGDSFTYGSYLSHEHTYVGHLERLLPDKEMINAAQFGYTIEDEATLFSERAKFTEPDIVVLQVLENDIFGLTALLLQRFSRGKSGVKPSGEESAFFAALRTNSKASDGKEIRVAK